MVEKILRSFDVRYLQILDEQGNADEKLMPKLDDKLLLNMYWFMVLSRKFDEKALALQRQGRIGTYASVLGQEASQVGAGLALNEKDFTVPSFRENALLIARGMPMKNLFLYWGGDERGNGDKANGNNLPMSIPVGTQMHHGVGIAWAMKLKNEPNVVATFFGDGGSSKGDFYEAMNFAGVFQVPCIFVCQNNQFAISVRRERQTKAETIAQKAIAAGFEGIQVDGNDIIAVYSAIKEAAAKARTGKGPTLIECFTYRMGDHTTADDAKRYRSQKELDEWKKKDPLIRLEKYLMQKNLLTAKMVQEFAAKATEQVEEAVKEYEATPKAEIDDIFKYTFAKMTQQQQEQLDYLKKFENNGEENAK